jgi:pilus assembly protein CpaF
MMPWPEAREDAGDGAHVTLSALYQDLKFRILDLVHDYIERRGAALDHDDRTCVEEIRREIARAASLTIAGAGIALNSAERQQLSDDVMNEIVGFGPLQPLLNDETVDDIIVNGHDCIYVERRGVLEPVEACFRDRTHLSNVIQRIVSPLGRRVDESSPFVDARLPDGSRVNVAVPPVAIDGPAISIRKFKRVPLTMRDLVERQALSAEMAECLEAACRQRRNILVSGGTGSGKTTLLNILSSFIGEKERVITIEDAAELQLRSPHVLRMETRECCGEGVARITARDILRNALRMRPDRIILGEVRGGEAVEMLQAMTTGHDGSMSTLHANNPQDAVKRLELLLAFGGLEADPRTVRRQIASAIHMIVQVQRYADGLRRISRISEIAGMEGDVVLFDDLFSHDAASGRFAADGRARLAGLALREGGWR